MCETKCLCLQRYDRRKRCFFVIHVTKRTSKNDRIIVLTAEEKDLTITDDLTLLVFWDTASYGYGSRTEANSERGPPQSTAEAREHPNLSKWVRNQKSRRLLEVESR